MSTYILNYDVHVITCPHKLRRSFQFSIFIHSDEWNFINLIPQCIVNKFEDVNKRTFSSRRKFKGVWSGITYSHKSRGEYTESLNIEKRKIHLKHGHRGGFWDINGHTSGNFSCLGQKDLRGQGDFWEILNESFYCH